LKNFIQRLFASCAILAVLAGTLFALPTAVSAADSVPGNATMSISPATTQVNPGDTFTVKINLESDTFLRAASCIINYDTKYLECVSAEVGSIFSDWATANGADTYVTPKPNVTKTPGEVNTGVTIIGGEAFDGPKSGAFLEFQFKAKSGMSGSTDITLSDVQIYTSIDNGETMSVLLSGITSENGRVTVGTASSTPPPTSSATTTAPASTIKTTSSTPTTSSQPVSTPPPSTPKTTTQSSTPAPLISQPPATTTTTGGGQTIPWAIVGGTIGLVLLAGGGGFIILNKKK
jgi:hypothetical protein